MKINCKLCQHSFNNDISVEPYLIYNNNYICFNCYIGLSKSIYKMSGFGDGGLIHLIYKDCLSSNHNKKKRSRIKNYKDILKILLNKHKFKCVVCDSKENLTIDHIQPVSKGGSDTISNLQILCKSCNSRKGNRHEN